MNWDYGVNVKAILEHIDSAETFSIFFPTLRKALVVDMRHGPEDGPFVSIMPMARSPHDRVRSIRRARPHLPRPTQMVAIPWPVYIENLVRSGVWERLATRITDSGSEDSARALQKALEQLRHFESSELATLIRGDHHKTIWSRND